MSTQDPRPLQQRAAGVLAELVAAVRPEQLEHPTPCSEFGVRDLLAHVVDATHGLAQVGEGGAREDTGAPAADAVPDDGWPAVYQEARERFTAAWADSTKLDASFSVPWGRVTGGGVVAGAAMETAAHAWDLAQALGVRELPDQELAVAVLEMTRPMVGAERRGGGVPFEPVQDAPEGADAYGRLAAWLGRRHDWSDGA